MTIKDALAIFYCRNKLNLCKDLNSRYVKIHIGKFLIPVPNIGVRKRYLKLHDLHHVLTGYGIDKVGESEISAWELGSGSYRKPMVSVMNLFGLFNGWIDKPKRIVLAFYRGCRSKNLYYLTGSHTDLEIEDLVFETIKKEHVEIKNSVKFKTLRQLEFSCYLLTAMFIYIIMLAVGKIIIVAKAFTNKR